MRGYIAMSTGLAGIIIVAFLSRSVSIDKVYSARTGKRVIQRAVEGCQRALAHSDRSPIMNVVHATTARTWAEAALSLASEETIRTIAGVDLPHLIDRCERKLDAAVRDVNRQIPRSSRARISPDQVLVT